MFKVGDIVKVKQLVYGSEYGTYCNEKMVKYSGKVYRISAYKKDEEAFILQDIHTNEKVGCGEAWSGFWVFSSDMLDPFNPKLFEFIKSIA